MLKMPSVESGGILSVTGRLCLIWQSFLFFFLYFANECVIMKLYFLAGCGTNPARKRRRGFAARRICGNLCRKAAVTLRVQNSAASGGAQFQAEKWF